MMFSMFTRSYLLHEKLNLIQNHNFEQSGIWFQKCCTFLWQSFTQSFVMQIAAWSCALKKPVGFSRDNLILGMRRKSLGQVRILFHFWGVITSQGRLNLCYIAYCSLTNSLFVMDSRSHWWWVVNCWLILPPPPFILSLREVMKTLRMCMSSVCDAAKLSWRRTLNTYFDMSFLGQWMNYQLNTLTHTNICVTLLWVPLNGTRIPIPVL